MEKFDTDYLIMKKAIFFMADSTDIQLITFTQNIKMQKI